MNEAVTGLSCIPLKIKLEHSFKQQKGWKQLVDNLFEAAHKSSAELAAGVLVTTQFL